MKRLLLFGIVACLSGAVSAQRVYFVYLQTDDQTPFYVRMADKIHSSSAAGYLILPNLTDSTYILGIGFAKSTQPETRFAVTVNQNDKGYLLKTFSDGLALFDVQDLSVVKSISAAKDNTVYETKTDKFSSILSKAADDPGLLRVAVPKKEEPLPKIETKETVTVKAEDVAANSMVEKTKDSLAATSPETIKTEVVKKDEPLVNEPLPTAKVDTLQTTAKEPEVVVPTTSQTYNYKSLAVVRRSESSTTEGFGIVYLDRMVDKIDTVRILIPPSKFSLEQEAQTISPVEPEQKKADIIPEPQPIKAEAEGTKAEVAVEKKENLLLGSVKSTENKPLANTGCKEVATDKDFMKLRKNMAAKSNDDEMIVEARKSFKSRCFAVEQIRYLSTLFLTAGAKYQFFDAAYAHVLDKENFVSLQSEIKDEYYLKRFKALVGE